MMTGRDTTTFIEITDHALTYNRVAAVDSGHQSVAFQILFVHLIERSNNHFTIMTHRLPSHTLSLSLVLPAWRPHGFLLVRNHAFMPAYLNRYLHFLTAIVSCNMADYYTLSVLASLSSEGYTKERSKGLWSDFATN